MIFLLKHQCSIDILLLCCLSVLNSIIICIIKIHHILHFVIFKTPLQFNYNFFFVLIDDKSMQPCKAHQCFRKVWRWCESKQQHAHVCPNTKSRCTVKATVVNMLVLCCSNTKLLIYDQMTNYLWGENRLFKTCCDFLCVSVQQMDAHTPQSPLPKTLCTINTITLMMGPVLLLEEYRSFLQIISHPLTFSEPQFHQWAAGRAHRQLWKSTTYVSAGSVEPSVLVPHAIALWCPVVLPNEGTVPFKDNENDQKKKKKKKEFCVAHKFLLRPHPKVQTHCLVLHHEVDGGGGRRDPSAP